MQVMKVTAMALPWLICCVPIRIFIKFLLLLTTGHLCVSCAILIHWSARDAKQEAMKPTFFSLAKCGTFPQQGVSGFKARRTSPTPHSIKHLIAPDEANPMRFTCHSHSRERWGDNLAPLQGEDFRLGRDRGFIPLTLSLRERAG